MLIENYYTFLKTHTKFHKSPALNLNRYGFTEIDEEFIYKMNMKPKEYIKNFLKGRNLVRGGHIVFRHTTHTYGERALEIWYNRKILDKYGNRIEDSK